METLNLIKNDPWLEPYEDAINGRHQHALDKEAELTNKGKQTLSDFASGYLYFGLHRTADGWIFRDIHSRYIQRLERTKEVQSETQE